MKKIMCYGDSNTWGQGKSDFDRLEKRWTQLLNKKFEIIEEGLCRRTAGNLETGDREYVNGLSHFETILMSQRPLDIVIIALGTNDFKDKFNQSGFDIAKNLLKYSEIVKLKLPNVRVIYLTPPKINAPYFSSSDQKNADLISELKKANVEVVDFTNTIVLGGDGVHFNNQNHFEIVKRLEEII